MPATGMEVAARRTPKGYTIEASIPTALLGIQGPTEGLDIAGELAVSDSDLDLPKQEKMMTLSTDIWQSHRARLRQILFGNAAGKATPPPKSTVLLDKAVIPAGGSKELTFTAPETSAGRETYLFLRARIHWYQVAGYSTGALWLTLNGKSLEGSRFSNRPLTSKTAGGLVESLIASTGEASVFFSPDFTATEKDPHYGLLGGAKACEFEYRVTDLLQPGQNTLLIENRSVADAENPRSMTLGDVSLLLKLPPPPPRPRRPAPTGEIPTIQPRAEFKTTYTAEEKPGGAISVTAGGETFVVESRFSSPDGTWSGSSTPEFEHSRRIERDGEAIRVFDTFKNLTQEDLPLMQRHTADLKGRLDNVWIAGLAMPSKSGSKADPGNPSVFGSTKKAGLGLMTLSDAFQVHVQTSCLGETLGLADNAFVLAPGATYTAEWAIVPTESGKFWDFVNAARRVRDVNFLLPYQNGFLRAGPRWDVESWPDERVRDFLVNRDLHLSCAANGYPTFEGKAPYSTSFQKVDHSVYAKDFELRKKLVPGLRNVIYYHCFLDNFPGNEVRFKDAAVLKADGTQMDYGGAYSYDKVFFPTDTNAFGKETAKTVDLIFDACMADGVFWDEMEYCRSEYHYGEPWDGVSGDIDQDSGRLLRKKSSLALLSQEFRAALARKILARGPLYANGSPHTRTIANLKFQRFTETGTISNCASTLLYSPVALGDHLTERTEEDAYNVMLAALDYGCLYNWYSDRVELTHPTLAGHMFPITPMELHEGYIIGRERIITKASGIFGWGDDSSHTVHVFNEKGVEVPDFKAPLVRKDGKTFTELRLPEDWSAAILREGAADRKPDSKEKAQ